MTAFFGVGIAMVAQQWDAMPAGSDKDAMMQGFATLYWALNGAFSVAIVVYWSALLLLFIAITISRVYPTWLGWAGLINAVVVIPVGFVYAYAEPSQGLQYVFGGLAGLSTLWVLILGIVISRKAW